jgi:GT2 family glycosyltransferase
MTDSDSKYKIAIVMPVLNEERFLGGTLDQVYMQDFPMEQVEVVIADGGSTDRTRDIAAQYKDRFGSLKILDNPRRLSSAGRNIGVRNSSAPYILVLDGHSYLPGKTLLEDMVELFESTDADCLCRPQPLNPPDISDLQRVVACCRASALGHNPSSDIYSDFQGTVDPTSSGAMYRRSVFEQIGYFDENFDACEDVDFNFRIHMARLKAIISPKLKVFYYPRATLTGLWRQMVRYGKGRFRLAHKHRQLAPMQMLAAVGIVALALLLLLSLVSEAAWNWLTTLIGIYVLVVVGYSAWLAHDRERLGCLLVGPLVFPIIHFGLGWGFLMGFVDRLQAQRQPSRGGAMDINLD